MAATFALLVPHTNGVTWKGLLPYLVRNHEAKQHSEPCGCLIANVELFGHDEARCTNYANNRPAN